MNDDQTRAASKVPVLDMSSDIMSYTACHRRYMYYNMLGYPQTNNILNWSSHFILGFINEAYNDWKEGNLDLDDEYAYLNICEKVRRSMLSGGMAAMHSLYSSNMDRSRNFLMNNRARNVLKFAAESVFPFISSIKEVLYEYIDSDRPCSVKGSCGVMSSELLRKDRDGILAKAILSDERAAAVFNSDDDFEVLFQFKGTDCPAENSLSRMNHAVQMGALMEMRNRMNVRMGRNCRVVVGFVFYLNEMWYSLDKIRTILDDPDTDDDIKDKLRTGEQLPFEDRVYNCVHTEFYDEDSGSGSIRTLGRFAGGLVKAVTNEGGYDIDDWKPGDYSESRCSACDFRNSCKSVPEENRQQPWKD